jgi:hypothetical protein
VRELCHDSKVHSGFYFLTQMLDPGMGACLQPRHSQRSGSGSAAAARLSCGPNESRDRRRSRNGRARLVSDETAAVCERMVLQSLRLQGHAACKRL